MILAHLHVLSPPFYKGSTAKRLRRIWLLLTDCFLLHLKKSRGRQRLESQNGKDELRVYFAKSPGTLFFSSFIVYKTHFALSLHVTLCSVIQFFNFSYRNLFWSFRFGSPNTVQTKAGNHKIQTGTPTKNIWAAFCIFHFLLSSFRGGRILIFILFIFLVEGAGCLPAGGCTAGLLTARGKQLPSC